MAGNCTGVIYCSTTNYVKGPGLHRTWLFIGLGVNSRSSNYCVGSVDHNSHPWTIITSDSRRPELVICYNWLLCYKTTFMYVNMWKKIRIKIVWFDLHLRWFWANKSEENYHNTVYDWFQLFRDSYYKFVYDSFDVYDVLKLRKSSHKKDPSYLLSYVVISKGLKK